MRLTIFLFLATSQFVIGQAALNDLKFNIYQNLNSSVIQNYIRQLNEAETFEDSEFIFEYDDWQKAYVIAKNGEAVEIDSANYHLRDANIFFMREGQMYFLYPEKLESVKFNDKTFVPVKANMGNKKPYDYFERLVNGELILLKHKRILQKKVNDHPMGISSGIEKMKSYAKYKLYYCDKEYDELKEVPRKKMEFIRIFKRDRNRMIQYAKENDISTKHEPDVIKMFIHYNSNI